MNSIDLHIWEFPLSLILAAALVAGVILCGRNQEKNRLVSLLSDIRFSALLLVLVALSMAVEGTWKLMVFRSWPFLALIVLTMFSLGLTVYGSITSRKPLAFTLSHLGFFLILFGGFFGAPDFKDVQMVVNCEEASDAAYSYSGNTVPLSFSVRLEEFRTDCYDDGVSPKQYTSVLDIDGRTYSTSVNHPLHHKGWVIYQYDYDHERGRYSVLKLVRDPWLPVVWLGMFLMVLAALMSLKRTWKSKAAIPVAIGVAAVFCFISLMKINFGTLMPALRSLWFVPHLIIYMLAYSLLAIALLMSLFWRSKAGETAGKLLSTASSLLLVGMLCGAVWAKQAWGDYWTWDAKECWAAVTWIITLLGSHIERINKKMLTAVILMAFLSMQVTWYGVNWLPSSEYSMHTYN